MGKTHKDRIKPEKVRVKTFENDTERYSKKRPTTRTLLQYQGDEDV